MNKISKKKFTVPNVYIIIMAIAFVAMLLTRIIPAGEYNRIANADGRLLVDPTSYHLIDANPQGIFDFFKAFHTGLTEMSGIIFFLFLVGGCFAVVEATGAIEALLGKVVKAMSGRERIVIPIVMMAFAVCGATFGMAEEALPFIPIMVTMALSLGFDSMTGAAMVLVGCSAGFAGAFLSPFTIGIAQSIAGLPMASGMGLRIILFVIMCTVMITFVYLYAGKVKKNPTLSSMYETDLARDDKLDTDNLKPLERKHVVIVMVVAASIVTFTYGVIQYGWSMREISAVFMIMAVLAAIIGRLGLNKFADSFTSGMATLASGAIIVGFARAILVLMTDGGIMDTILFEASNLVAGMPKGIAAVGMYLFQCLLNFLIPSGSGQAAVSMPIMAPLGDILGITRQTSVLAFQLGDGISNIFTPTSGYFMAGLALARIPWQKWAKWFIPCIMVEYLIGAIFILIATYIQYGPF